MFEKFQGLENISLIESLKNEHLLQGPILQNCLQL
jgi:hypothetical protein